MRNAHILILFFAAFLTLSACGNKTALIAPNQIGAPKSDKMAAQDSDKDKKPGFLLD